MQSYSSTIYLFLVLLVLGSAIVDGEPEPMARPTRPEVFTSPEELRRYLDHVSDYYSLNGKARYGKRGNILSSTSDVDHVWDVVKTILENSHRSQRPKLEEPKQKEDGFLGERESYAVKKDVSRIGGARRPCRVLDIAERYYDDMQ